MVEQQLQKLRFVVFDFKLPLLKFIIKNFYFKKNLIYYDNAALAGYIFIKKKNFKKNKVQKKIKKKEKRIL